MKEEKNEFMKFDFFVRMFKDGKWQAVNIKNMTEDEFRQFLFHKLGFVGMKRVE